jgi:DNA-binding response OmpR family regulator
VSEEKRILIIDDEPDMGIMLRQVLEGALFKVHLITNPHVGLESALHDPPDLLLLDIRMPELDGLEVLKRLRESEKTKKTPVILITGNPNDVDVMVTALALNPTDLITKTISPKELVARVQLAFRRHELE